MHPISTDIAFATPYFEILAKTMRPGEPPWYSLRLPDYVSVLPMTSDGRIVLVRQYRPAVERVTLELPSGLVDPGETPLDTARRELLEETAYEAGAVKSLGAMLPDTGRLGNRIWTCVATGVRPAPGRAPEAGMEIVLYTPLELFDSVKAGVFDHALHVAALLAAQLHGKIQIHG
ncbi:MAG TPA: NUDIX hydrolase [Bryobacteraceae bacterium]